MTTLDKYRPVRSNSKNTVHRVQPVPGARPLPRQDIADDGKTLPNPVHAKLDEEEKKKRIKQAVKNISGYVQNISRELNFDLDEESGGAMVTVRDEKSGEIIRRIPSEEMLEIARNLADAKEKTTRGILFEGDA